MRKEQVGGCIGDVLGPRHVKAAHRVSALGVRSADSRIAAAKLAWTSLGIPKFNIDFSLTRSPSVILSAARLCWTSLLELGRFVAHNKNFQSKSLIYNDCYWRVKPWDWSINPIPFYIFFSKQFQVDSTLSSLLWIWNAVEPSTPVKPWKRNNEFVGIPIWCSFWRNVSCVHKTIVPWRLFNGSCANK